MSYLTNKKTTFSFFGGPLDGKYYPYKYDEYEPIAITIRKVITSLGLSEADYNVTTTLGPLDHVWIAIYKGKRKR